MEKFRGIAHLPGDNKESHIELEIDWLGKETYISIDEAPGGIKEWPGLMVQTIGIEEAIFRTKGIPPLFTHWWHLARNADDNLWGLIIATPDVKGNWQTCPLFMEKVK